MGESPGKPAPKRPKLNPPTKGEKGCLQKNERRVLPHRCTLGPWRDGGINKKRNATGENPRTMGHILDQGRTTRGGGMKADELPGHRPEANQKRANLMIMEVGEKNTDKGTQNLIQVGADLQGVSYSHQFIGKNQIINKKSAINSSNSEEFLIHRRAGKKRTNRDNPRGERMKTLSMKDSHSVGVNLSMSQDSSA